MSGQTHHLDWNKIATVLNWSPSEEGKAWRQKQWKNLDINGNNLVSLAEYQRFVRDTLKLEEYFFGPADDYKIVLLKAHQASIKRGKATDGFLHFSEFKMMLHYTRIFLEFYAMFDELDTNDDERIGKAEFMKGVEILNKYGAKIADPEAEFKEIDKNGGGSILFDEFLTFAGSHKLDLDDDDD